MINDPLLPPREITERLRMAREAFVPVMAAVRTWMLSHGHVLSDYDEWAASRMRALGEDLGGATIVVPDLNPLCDMLLDCADLLEKRGLADGYIDEYWVEWFDSGLRTRFLIDDIQRLRAKDEVTKRAASTRVWGRGESDETGSPHETDS